MIERNDNVNTVKYITFNDLCNAVLAARDDSQVQSLASPLLPKNCIQYIERNNGELAVVMEREAKATDFSYGDKVFKKIGVPKLLFAFRILANTLQEGYVVAVKDNLVSEDTELYHYPFSNVYRSGSICWGNKLPTYGELRYLQNVPEMFLSMENNNHNYGHINLSGLEYRPLLEVLEGQKFREDWLKSMEIRYGDWLNQVLRKTN